MSKLLLKIMLSILGKLLTERFFCEGIILAASYISKSTKNTLDDDGVAFFAKHLGVKIGK